MFLPRSMFFTKGVGRHKEKLASFEEALRDAHIERFNLVPVSSIFPPHCKIISPKKGLERLKSGQIIFCVMSRNDSNENRRLISASVGVAIPNDPNQHGYLSEDHRYGDTEEQAGDYAEDLAAQMLATTMGIDFKANAVWDEKKGIWKISRHVIRTINVTQSAIGIKNMWTSVVAAAVLIP